MIRSDKKESLLKVADIVLNDPLLSQRDIAEKTWLWLWTVNRAINDLEQIGTKSEDIMKVCETDFNIVKLWQKIIEERLQKKEEVEKMRTFEIAQTIEKSGRRYMLFKWQATDNEGWAKDITTINIL